MWHWPDEEREKEIETSTLAALDACDECMRFSISHHEVHVVLLFMDLKPLHLIC